MMTLLQMRTAVRDKLNQTSTSGNLVYDDDEIDNNIRSGIRAVVERGRLELINDSFQRSTAITISGAGLATKPDSYLRFVSADIDGVIVEEIKPMNIHDRYENNEILAGSATLPNIYDYGSGSFLVKPITASYMTLFYIYDLQTSDIDADTDTSPLTYTGDEHAIEFAYGFCLVAKQFNPELGQRILGAVEQRIK